MRAVILSIVFALASAMGVLAQDTPALLVIDPERVYNESARGQAILAELEAEATALQAENEQIVRDLIAEEQDLAVRRKTMDPEAFRAEAEAFDQKAQEIRRAREIKELDLNQKAADARTAFFDDLRPIIGQILIERGGTAVLDSRSVYLVLRSADITEAAIAAIDAPSNLDE